MAHGYRPVISKIRCNNPNKTGTRVKNYNYLHYIATREGVDLTGVSSRMTIDEMLDENLDLNETGEERAFVESSDEVYLKYMAHRPRSHGLFGNINTDNFSDVSSRLNKAYEEKKNIYRGVISLSSLDAEALGYKNINKWNLYLKSVMPDIAAALRLSPNNITWVAAFHMEDSHPHVHYMLWDNGDKIRTPYIHVSQQQACREICQNAMFSDADEVVIRQITAAEREEYYGIQNASRKELMEHFKNIFAGNEPVPGIVKGKLPDRISADEHEKLNDLYKKILSSMPGKGRIAYQFMPVECKAYIDRVSQIFLNRADINKEYERFVRAVRQIQRSLGKNKEEISQAEETSVKEIYNRVGNIVLKAVSGMKSQIMDGQPEENWKSGEIDIYELFQMGKSLSDKGNENYNLAEGISYLEQAAEKGSLPARMKLSRIYLQKENFDIEKACRNIEGAIQTVEKKQKEGNAAESEILNRLSAYWMLGRLFSDRNAKYCDYKKALESFTVCINEGMDENMVNKARLQTVRIYADKEGSYCYPDIAEKELAKVWKYVAQQLEKCRRYRDKYREGTLLDEDKDQLDSLRRQLNPLCMQLARLYADQGLAVFDYKKALEALMVCINEGPDENEINKAKLQLIRIYSDKQGSYYYPEEAGEELKKLWNYTAEQLEKYREYRDRQEQVILSEEDWKQLDSLRRQLNPLCMQLARLYADPDLPKCDCDKAIQMAGWYQETKTEELLEDSGEADLLYGNIYSQEKFKVYNMETAVNHYREAVIKGNSVAMVKLAKCCLFGLGVKKDKEAAKALLLEAVQRENRYAEKLLAQIDRMDFISWKGHTCMLLRQIFSSMEKTRQKKELAVQETEFRTKSRQVQKEEYLHRN